MSARQGLSARQRLSTIHKLLVKNKWSAKYGLEKNEEMGKGSYWYL